MYFVLTSSCAFGFNAGCSLLLIFLRDAKLMKTTNLRACNKASSTADHIYSRMSNKQHLFKPCYDP